MTDAKTDRDATKNYMVANAYGYSSCTEIKGINTATIGPTQPITVIPITSSGCCRQSKGYEDKNGNVNRNTTIDIAPSKGNIRNTDRAS